MEPKKKLALTPLFSFLLPFLGCSTTPKVPPSITPPPSIQTTQIDQLEKLNQRIHELELKILTLNDKLDLNLKQRAPAQTSKESRTQSQIMTTNSLAAIQDEAGEPPKPSKKKTDPEYGFSDDTSIRSYRQAMIYFQARKFPEAILELTQFIGQYPDHILAGSAQYYCGESYYQQKEYNLALKEFQSVISSYPQSQHIADTLRRISEIHTLQSNQEQSAGAAELLNSLFPHSPAASDREKPTESLATPTLDSSHNHSNQTKPGKEVLRDEDQGT